MHTHSQVLLAVVMAASSSLSDQMSAAPVDADKASPNRIKEVLLSEGGKTRHWVVRSNALIVEEHCLTAHGDLHVMVEYPKGVRTPQVDAPNAETNAESVATIFWPSGKRMSRTPAVGGEPHGQDLVWWPNGELAREAKFAMGMPSGVWKFYDMQGKAVGEGTFVGGQQQSGVFIGNSSAGGDFFFTSYPMKKRRFEQGKVTDEEMFLKELEVR